MEWYFIFLPSFIGGLIIGWHLRSGHINRKLQQRLEEIMERSDLRWDSNKRKLVKKRRNSDQTVM